MKHLIAILLTSIALTATAADVKKPCKKGQTEADGCRVVQKIDKNKKPEPKKQVAKKDDKKKK